MNVANSSAVLATIFRREGRSYLQYVGEAFPWTTSQDEQSVDRLQTVVAEDRAAVARLARFLGRQRISVGPLEAFPARWTSINFAALEHVLPLLLQSQKESVAALTHELAALTDAAQRREVEALLTVKRRHLEVLEQLAAHHSQLTATLH